MMLYKTTMHFKRMRWSSLEVGINVEVSSGAGLRHWRCTAHDTRFLIFSNTLLEEVRLAFERNVVHEVKRVFCTPYLNARTSVSIISCWVFKILSVIKLYGSNCGVYQMRVFIQFMKSSIANYLKLSASAMHLDTIDVSNKVAAASLFKCLRYLTLR